VSAVAVCGGQCHHRRQLPYLGSAYTEDQPLLRVAALWGVCLWVFGFGHPAAVVLRPALRRDRLGQLVLCEGWFRRCDRF
jgi:hypothetical protein